MVNILFNIVDKAHKEAFRTGGLISMITIYCDFFLNNFDITIHRMIQYKPYGTVLYFKT